MSPLADFTAMELLEAEKASTNVHINRLRGLRHANVSMLCAELTNRKVGAPRNPRQAPHNDMLRDISEHY